MRTVPDAAARLNPGKHGEAPLPERSRHPNHCWLSAWNRVPSR